MCFFLNITFIWNAYMVQFIFIYLKYCENVRKNHIITLRPRKVICGMCAFRIYRDNIVTYSVETTHNLDWRKKIPTRIASNNLYCELQSLRPKAHVFPYWRHLTIQYIYCNAFVFRNQHHPQIPAWWHVGKHNVISTAI